MTAKRALPTLRLPAAHLRIWSTSPQDQRVRETMRAYAALPGVTQLGDHHLTVVPGAGREHVFDDAVALANAVLGRLRQLGAEAEAAGILIFPAQVLERGSGHLAVHDELLEDLDKRAPRFTSQGLFLTGYAASWLRGRLQFESAGLYSGPSGRRVPLQRLAGEAAQLHPWHNPRLLGRTVKVAREQLDESLDEARRGRLLVTGTLGTGKSHLLWHFLEKHVGPKIWTRPGRNLFGTAGLTRRLVTELFRVAAQDLPAEAADLRRPESVEPSRAAQLLVPWLAKAGSRLGGPVWIVCDGIQTAVPADLELVGHLLESPECGTAFRVVTLGRTGSDVAAWQAALPRVEVPPLDERMAEDLAQRLVAGLEMPETVRRRLVEAAAGYPYALEELLVALVHHGVIRRVYGSFFFGGSEETDFKVSQRVVRHVEAELRRLGDPLPLRILAAADQTVGLYQLEEACAAYDVRLPEAWQRDFVGTGWLRVMPSAGGSTIQFTCPAFRKAVLDTLPSDSVESLRQALGQVVVAAGAPTSDTAWQAYQLLAGSADALASLLKLSRQSDGKVSREEIFEAMLKEHRLLRERQGDAATELDLLWKLLPLAHHLGRLPGLEAELARAVALAAEDHPARFSALALLKAEHDQEQGRFRDAAIEMRRALQVSQGRDEQRLALIFLRYGKLLARQERFEEASEVLSRLVAVVNRHEPTLLGAHAQFYLGNVAFYEGRLDEAADYHARALEIRQTHKLPKAIGASLSAHGALALAQGDYPSALSYCEKACEVLSDQDEDAEIAFALLGLGRAFGHLGNHTAATKPLRRALELREGRGDIAGEAIARLDLAANQLEQGHADAALKMARRAHFDLYLLPCSSLLGDAALLVGRILLQLRKDEAEERFREALRIHSQRDNPTAAVLDSSYLLDLAVQRNDLNAIINGTAELEARIEKASYLRYGEQVHFRLFRALDWLRSRRAAAREPMEELRKAHRELMRKTAFLKPEERHVFLFHNREHQDLLHVASEHQLSLPSFSTRQILRDPTLTT